MDDSIMKKINIIVNDNEYNIEVDITLTKVSLR